MTKHDPKPIFLEKKNQPEQIFRKTSWKFILHPAPGNCGKERFTSGFPEGNPKCFMILVVFLASWWNLQKICIPNLPDVFFSDDSPFGSGSRPKKIARSKRPICDEGIDRADDFWKIDESSLKRRHVLHHLLLALWRPGSHRELPDVLFVNVCDVQKDTHSYIWGEVQYSMHNPQQHIHFNHPEKHRVVPKMSLCRSCSPRDSPIPKKNIYFIRYYSRRVS